MSVRRLFLWTPIIVATACGGSDGDPAVDAATVDAAPPPDEQPLPPDAPAMGTASVVAYRRGAPLEPAVGVDLVISHADGTPAGTATTDAAGEATIDVTGGDSVTALYRRADGTDAITIAGVEPGDTLQFGRPSSPSDATVTGTMTFQWPVLSAEARYTVYTPCGLLFPLAGASSVEMTQHPHCETSTVDVLYTAEVGLEIVQYGVLQDVPFVDGGTAVLDQWQNATTFTLHATGLPDALVYAGLSIRSEWAGRSGPSLYAIEEPVADALSETHGWAPVGDGILGDALFKRAGLGDQWIWNVALPATATEWTVSDPITLPWLGEVIASPAVGEVAWIREGDGTYDYAVVYLAWDRVDAGSSHTWRLVVPPGTDATRLPELPAGLADAVPPAGAALDAMVRLVDYTDDPGYDTSRARPEWQLTGAGLDPTWGEVHVSVSVEGTP